MNDGGLYAPPLCPQLRTEIVFGPAETNGRTVIYHVKDRATDWFYRIGVREYFLLSRMDGSRTLEEIGDEYRAHFGRQLDARAWGDLFNLLEQRQMLAHSATPAGLAALREKLAERRGQENRNLLRRRFPIVKPDRFLGEALSWLGFALNPAFAWPAAIAIIAAELFIVLNWQAIGADAWAVGGHYGVFVALVLFLWLYVAQHELAHGLACKYYGGSVSEMGLMWRYLTFVFYCKIEDVLLFHDRRHRLYTAFAGVFANLLLLPLLVLLWRFLPGGSIRTFSALALILVNGTCLVNLFPFVELDGYYV
ncbi:MAG: hypothetical protein CVT68_12610, partial [Actinobacteria bacterium HGW-Actinobacteria-8]